MAYELEEGDDREVFRCFYYTLEFRAWHEKKLLPSPKLKGATLPFAQADALIAHYMTGGIIQPDNDMHILKPKNFNIWEFKTTDVRIFGWFWKRDIFVAAGGAFKDELLQKKGGSKQKRQLPTCINPT